MENPYSKSPLQITLYDAQRRTVTRTYMLLGDAPRGVRAAVRKKWKGATAETLRRYYGPKWKQKLTPSYKFLFPDTPLHKATGGGDSQELDFGNLDIYDDADTLAEMINPLEDPSSVELPPVGLPAIHELGFLPDQTQKVVYTEEAAYPEDTITNLKEKIYSITEIPPWRQHIFYSVEGVLGEGKSRLQIPYRLTLGGTTIMINIRTLYLPRGNEETIAGVPIDKRLEENKEEVRVNALDSFILLGATPERPRISRVFVADLYYILKQSQQREREIMAATEDKYKFDLLYYGFIVKYWPQLPPNGFRFAIKNRGELKEIYPLLEPPLAALRRKLNNERRIISQTYARSYREVESPGARRPSRSLAVTKASINVLPKSPETRFNLRNIFDRVSTSKNIPAVISRLPEAALYPETSVGRRRDYFLVKRHVSSYSPTASAALESFITRAPTRPVVAFAVARHISQSLYEKRPFLFLTLEANGHYTIAGTWREDDRADFEIVMDQLSKGARGIIRFINSLGTTSRNAGLPLETPFEARRTGGGRTRFENLTVSVFWPRAFTTQGFHELKKRWRTYESAGVVGIKGLQQTKGYSFRFRKGITDYDIGAYERVITARGVLRQVPNTYIHLTDPALYQVWIRLYGGRTVRIHHRTTDLKVEMIGVDLQEYELVRFYIFVFLRGLITGNNRLHKGVIPPTRTAVQKGNRLKRLQEKDPDLFDLKKYEEGVQLYSVLCQRPMQPHLYDKKETKKLSARDRSNLVRYWNFTEGKPAYYLCPNRKYSHLSFKSGVHPLGYCLPCCQMSPALPGSKRALVNTECLKKKKLTPKEIAILAKGAEDPLARARHVLKYGKVVPIGRLSAIPPVIEKELLYGILPRPYTYRLVGVKQSIPATPTAGYFYSISESLQIPPGELARNLAGLVMKLRDNYYILDSGAAVVFPHAEDLADAIVETFAKKSKIFTEFSPGGKGGEIWKNIIRELVYILYGIEVIKFIQVGEDFELEVSPVAVTILKNRELDFIVLFQSGAGTYPMFAMDQKLYLQERGRGSARRIYMQSLETRKQENLDTSANTITKTIANTTAEIVADRIPDIIYDMVKSQFARVRPPSSVIDLTFILEFIKSNHGKIYTLNKKLINERNLCYGVMLTEKKTGGHIYISVRYSAHYSDGYEVYYGARPTLFLSQTALEKCRKTINSFIKAKRKHKKPQSPQNYMLIKSVALLVHKDLLIGFVASAPPGSSGLRYYHDPVSFEFGINKNLPVVNLAYNPEDIDRAIYQQSPYKQPVSPLPPDKTIIANRGLYKNYLYKLFTAEFAIQILSERNIELRKQIAGFVQRIQPSDPKSLTKFWKNLSKSLKNYPNDFITIKKLISGRLLGKSISAATTLRKQFIDIIGSSSFEFDRVILHTLQSLGDKNAVAERLKIIMKPLVKLVPESKLYSDPHLTVSNIYSACSEEKREQCEGDRLKVPEKKFATLVDILAADILNPYKITLLSELASGVVDTFNFEKHPGERIYLKVL